MIESREPERKPSAKIPGVTPVDALKVSVWWPICILYACGCVSTCVPVYDNLHSALNDSLGCDFLSSRDSPLFFRGRLSE